ncbi:MAG: two-component system, chemotaxis family, sensor kinase CheA [Methanofollis sp.]|nr:two-component system, chemotaxis family, sensor kinase CheA [Methanofollis sp.]
MEEYRGLFVVESRENNDTIARALLTLEGGEDREIVDEIFRAAHTIKGASASMGFMRLERLCHSMEDVFDLIRNGHLRANASLTNLLLACTDQIEAVLDAVEAGRGDEEGTIEELVSALEVWVDETPSEAAVEMPASEDVPTLEDDALISAEGSRYQVLVTLAPASSMKEVRAMIALSNLADIGRIIATHPCRDEIENGKFDRTFEVVIESEAGADALRTAASGTDIQEVVVGPWTGAPETGKADSAVPKVEHHEKSREVKNIRVDIHLLDQMMNLVEDLVINRGRLKQIAQKHQIKELDEALNMVGRSVSDLQNLMMHIRMIPLNHIFNRFPRVVRDVSQHDNKEVEFIIEGGETELDRSVMDGLNEPLLHLIRNAVDHGIELPAERKAAGKSEKGMLRLSAQRDRDNVLIRIEDDGAGIDYDKVRSKAVLRGLSTEEDVKALSEDDLIDILFNPGFSTADAITDISGRGVGLDVVRSAIESLKGSINVSSTQGKGTCFELVLPPTMAIVEVMMVRINGKRCAIPINNVVEVAMIKRDAIHRVGNNQVILLRDEVMPLFTLDDMFGDFNRGDVLVVLQNGHKKCGIVSDVVEGQQEVVVKPLSSLIGICPGVSGVTIPGDGEVVPVLDVNTMF